MKQIFSGLSSTDNAINTYKTAFEASGLITTVSDAGSGSSRIWIFRVGNCPHNVKVRVSSSTIYFELLKLDGSTVMSNVSWSYSSTVMYLQGTSTLFLGYQTSSDTFFTANRTDSGQWHVGTQSYWYANDSDGTIYARVAGSGRDALGRTACIKALLTDQAGVWIGTFPSVLGCNDPYMAMGQIHTDGINNYYYRYSNSMLIGDN